MRTKTASERPVLNASGGFFPLVLVVTYDRLKSKSEWIMDSRFSFHVTPYKDIFTSYEEYNGGTVAMGNNATCKVICTGSVDITM